MASKQIQLLALSPDPSELARVLTKFGKEPGYVSAFDDARLGLARDLGFNDELLELVSFGDLLGRVCVEVGLRPTPIATRGQIRAAVEFACEEQPDESPFGKCRYFAGFHDTMVDALRELHHHDIGPDELEKAASLSLSPLKEKLLALREIDLAARESLLSIGRSFSSDRAKLIVESEISRAPHFTNLLVMAGSEVQPIELRALQRLGELGVAVTVSTEYGPGGFEGSRQIAALLGITPKPPKRVESWTSALFQDTKSDLGPTASVFDAADPLSECETALRKCQAEYSDGTPEHRIVIQVNDSQTYVPMLMASARRLDMRLDARVLTPLLTNGFANLIKSILEALTQPGVRGLDRISGSTYFGASQEERGMVSDFVRAVGPSPWEEAAHFAELHRESLPWLWPILKWRDKALLGHRSLTDWHELFEDLTRLDALESAAQDLESHKREHDRRAQTALLRALVDFAPAFDAKRQTSLDLAGFVRTATRLWDLEQIVLPSPGKGFRVVSNPVEIGQAEVVVSLGMLEGTMPKRRSENAILSDEDRAGLAECLPDTVPLPNSFVEARAQRDEFIRLCAPAKKKLIFGYPRTDEDRDNVPTSYIEEVKNVLGELKMESIPRKHFVPPEDECRLQVDLELRQALDRKAPPFEFPSIEDAAVRALIRPDFAGAGVRIGEVSSALRCAFQSVSAYRLHLRPSRLRLEGKLRRLPVRAGLLTASDAVSAENALLEDLKQIAVEESNASEPWERALLEAGATRYIRGWISREFRARSIWPRSGGRPRPEVTLSDPELRDTIKVDDRTVRFVGEVEGISDVGPYRVLHLFRSGEAQMPAKEKAEDQWLELAILLAAATQANRPVALEIDSTAGERKLVVLNRESETDGLFADSNFSLTIQNLETPPRAMKDELVAVLRRAIFTLDIADMRPNPGAHCSQCDFGEFCRVSSELIEMGDLFSEDTEVE